LVEWALGQQSSTVATLNGTNHAEMDCRIMNIGPARYLFRGDYLFVYTTKA
jgi:hypothetical protein